MVPLVWKFQHPVSTANYKALKAVAESQSTAREVRSLMFVMMFVFDFACCHGREAGGRNLFSSDLALAATCWLLPLSMLCAALLIGLLLLSGWIFHYSSSALKIDKYIVTMLIPGETKLIFFYDFGRALLRYVSVSGRIRTNAAWSR